MRRTLKKYRNRKRVKLILVRKTRKRILDGMKCSECKDIETCDLCTALKLSNKYYEEEKELDETLLESLKTFKVKEKIKVKETFKDWLKYKKETLDDGNCFYSAVYRAMKDKKLYDCLNNLEISIDDENKAIKKLRNIISNLSKEYLEQIKSDTILTDTYDELYGDDDDTSLSDIKTDTVNDILKKIKTDKIWATSLEFEVMEKLLSNLCDMKLKNIYDKKSISEEDNLERKDIIYVYNRNNIHFTYFHKDI